MIKINENTLKLMNTDNKDTTCNFCGNSFSNIIGIKMYLKS